MVFNWDVSLMICMLTYCSYTLLAVPSSANPTISDDSRTYKNGAKIRQSLLMTDSVGKKKRGSTSSPDRQPMNQWFVGEGTQSDRVFLATFTGRGSDGKTQVTSFYTRLELTFCTGKWIVGMQSFPFGVLNGLFPGAGSLLLVTTNWPIFRIAQVEYVDLYAGDNASAKDMVQKKWRILHLASCRFCN